MGKRTWPSPTQDPTPLRLYSAMVTGLFNLPWNTPPARTPSISAGRPVSDWSGRYSLGRIRCDAAFRGRNSWGATHLQASGFGELGDRSRCRGSERRWLFRHSGGGPSDIDPAARSERPVQIPRQLLAAVRFTSRLSGDWRSEWRRP